MSTILYLDLHLDWRMFKFPANRKRIFQVILGVMMSKILQRNAKEVQNTSGFLGKNAESVAHIGILVS